MVGGGFGCMVGCRLGIVWEVVCVYGGRGFWVYGGWWFGHGVGDGLGVGWDVVWVGWEVALGTS